MDEDFDEDESFNKEMRQQLADIPLGELQKLKEKMGLKLYNEAIFGSSKQQINHENTDDYIEETNETKQKEKFFPKQKQVSSEPLEISSKKRKQKPRHVVDTNKRKIRDPRFDDLSGKFNEKCYESSYSFLEDMRKYEFEDIRKQMKKEKNETKKKEMHKLLTRMKQQSKNKQIQEKQKKKQMERKKSEKVLIKQGKKPFYLKKSEQQKLDLFEKYKQLKSTGQLDKYMSKKRKRNATKEKRKLPELKS